MKFNAGREIGRRMLTKKEMRKVERRQRKKRTRSLATNPYYEYWFFKRVIELTEDEIINGTGKS